MTRALRRLSRTPSLCLTFPHPLPILPPLPTGPVFTPLHAFKDQLIVVAMHLALYALAAAAKPDLFAAVLRRRHGRARCDTDLIEGFFFFFFFSASRTPYETCCGSLRSCEYGGGAGGSTVAGVTTHIARALRIVIIMRSDEALVAIGMAPQRSAGRGVGCDSRAARRHVVLAGLTSTSVSIAGAPARRARGHERGGTRTRPCTRIRPADARRDRAVRVRERYRRSRRRRTLDSANGVRPLRGSAIYVAPSLSGRSRIEGRRRRAVAVLSGLCICCWCFRSDRVPGGH